MSSRMRVRISARSCIENQQKHPAKKSVRDEYTELLEKSGAEYDERYIFTPLEDTPVSQ